MTVKKKAALSIDRTGNKTKAALAGTAVKKKVKKIAASVVGEKVMVDRETLKQLVAETLETKRKAEGKKRQYKSRSSQIMRVPNELVPVVKKMVDGYRTKRREDPDRYR